MIPLGHDILYVINSSMQDILHDKKTALPPFQNDTPQNPPLFALSACTPACVCIHSWAVCPMNIYTARAVPWTVPCIVHIYYR